VAIIFAGTNGYLDSVAVGQLRAFETGLYAYLEARHPQVLKGIAEKKQLDDEVKAALKNAVAEFAADFARKASAA
jgi:F-type H+/Na+-transporting ATPase subunit alpha